MATVDRRGVTVDATDTPVAGNPNPGLAIKAPVAVATTAAITLSGLQTIDGVALAAGNRVLVKDQADATQNGIYNASSGGWTRAVDAAGNGDFANGLQVCVALGTANASTVFRLTSADPIVLGTSALTFVGLLPTPNPSRVGGVFSLTASPHLFLTGIGTDGNATRAQPAFTDISGVAAPAQLPLPTLADIGAVKALAASAHQFLTGIGTDGVPTRAQPAAADLADGTTGGGAHVVLADMLDADGTLAASSDTRIATQKAVKTYADQIVASADAMVFKGVIDCSANPNYPAADRGWTYRVSVAGKIGGASGVNVEAGDLLLCLNDGTPSGNQAAVGSSWSIAQANIDGAVTGPASSTSGNVATFNGVSGKVIQDSGKALPGGTIVGTTDSQTLSGKTIDSASNTLKLNGTSFITGGDLTALLAAMIGDSGSGGVKGLVPAAAAGDAAAGKFLKADGTFAVPPGSGGTTLTNLIRPEDYGAKGDGVVYTSGMAISASSPNLTISGYTPTSADVGKYVAIDGAGAAGACFVSTVSSISGSNLVLAANATTGVASAAGEIGTDDSVALHNMSAAAAGKAIWFGPGKIYFHKDATGNANIIRFGTGPFKIFGNGATIRAMANAPSATYGLMFCDSTFAGIGPAGAAVSDLTYHGNRTRRISSGAISASVGSGAGFYAIGCQQPAFFNCTALGTTNDGFYIGGDTRTGMQSVSAVFLGCYVDDAARNGFSVAGAVYSKYFGCTVRHCTFGAAHSNISYGWDLEPDGSWNTNEDIELTGCTASVCTTTGFGSNISLGSNTFCAMGSCFAEACGVGFYESGSGTLKVFACRNSGNTTNFTNLTERISGF